MSPGVDPKVKEYADEVAKYLYDTEEPEKKKQKKDNEVAGLEAKGNWLRQESFLVDKVQGIAEASKARLQSQQQQKSRRPAPDLGLQDQDQPLASSSGT